MAVLLLPVVPWGSRRPVVLPVGICNGRISSSVPCGAAPKHGADKGCVGAVSAKCHVSVICQDSLANTPRVLLSKQPARTYRETSRSISTVILSTVNRRLSLLKLLQALQEHRQQHWLLEIMLATSSQSVKLSNGLKLEVLKSTAKVLQARHRSVTRHVDLISLISNANQWL